MNNKEIALNAHLMLCKEKNIQTLSQYFAHDFISHSSLLQKLNISKNIDYVVSRVLSDNNGFVALHGKYTGLENQTLIGFDLYQIQNDKITEHWSSLVPEAPSNASGRTQLDGPTEVDENQNADENREFVKAFFKKTLIGSDYEGFREYGMGNTFYQHSSDIGDGIDNVIDYLNQLKKDGVPLIYHKIIHMIADGQFVLTHSEGEIEGVPHVYFELWRVENKHIIELWDAISPILEEKTL